MQAELFATESVIIVPQLVRRNGEVLPDRLVSEARAALRYFNERTGHNWGAFTGRGKPSESLSRIITAMLDYPEVQKCWQRMIDYTLAHPWWGRGVPHTGVVFGPRVVERSLAGCGTEKSELEQARAVLEVARRRSVPNELAAEVLRSEHYEGAADRIERDGLGGALLWARAVSNG